MTSATDQRIGSGAMPWTAMPWTWVRYRARATSARRWGLPMSSPWRTWVSSGTASMTRTGRGGTGSYCRSGTTPSPSTFIRQRGSKDRQRPVRPRPRRLANERPEIVGLSADLAQYTDMHIFRDAHPDRFFQVGMAEQAMLGAAAGMAEVGLVPFASTYAVFATRRAYDFLCLDIAEPALNVNVVGGLPGLPRDTAPATRPPRTWPFCEACRT
jgi:hypothetical protein